MNRLVAALAAALGLSVQSCATLPRDPAQRALYVDLRKTVQLSEDGGWILDAAEEQADREPALLSVCQVSPEVREDLGAWLRNQIALAGGPAKQAYRANGGDIDRVSTALSLERTLALLEYASGSASQDCPFWLSPRADFYGVQTDSHRWVLLAETLGFASYVVNTHIPTLSGGGRLFVGYGAGDRFTLALGGELAAGGSFIPSRNGGSGLGGTFTIAVPALLRLTRFSRLFDVELAPVVRFSGGADPLPPGARVQFGGGFSSLRSRELMPYFMLYAGYEYHPPTNGFPADHTVELGTRIAVDWGL